MAYSNFVPSPFLALESCLLNFNLPPRQEDLLYFLLKEVRNEQIERIDRELKNVGLLRSSFATLQILYAASDFRMMPSDLACKTGECRTNMTRIGNKLVKMQLVQRTACPLDRRSIRLELTPKGKQLVEDMLPRLRRIVNGHFSTLDNVEQEQLQKLLGKMLHGNSK